MIISYIVQYEIIYPDRFLRVDSYEKVFQKVCSEDNRYVAYLPERIFKAYKNFYCEMTPIHIRNIYKITSGIFRGFKYKKSLDLG